MNADQIKAAYPGYVGWNDRAAIEADFRATGGQGKGPPQPSYSSPGNVSIPQINFPDPVELAKKLRAANVEANQPAIKTQEASKQPILDRYNALLDQIKGKTTETTNLATQAITSSLGARGLLPNSPEGQTALIQGLEPINLQFSGLEKETGAQREQDIANINNAISMLQAGNPVEAAQSASNYASWAANAQAMMEAARIHAQTPFSTQPGQNIYSPASQTFATSPLPNFGGGGNKPAPQTYIPSPQPASPPPTPRVLNPNSNIQQINNAYALNQALNQSNTAKKNQDFYSSLIPGYIKWY